MNYKIYNADMKQLFIISATDDEDAITRAKNKGVVAPIVELVLTEQEQRQKNYEDLKILSRNFIN